jgi:hypothetical protein
MATVNDYDEEDALALFDFHELCAGVHGLVKSGVTKVPPSFLTHTPRPSTSPSRAPTMPSSLVPRHARTTSSRLPTMASQSALSSWRSPWSGLSTSSHWWRARCITLSRQPGLPPTPPYIGPSRRGTPSRLPTCLSCHSATFSFSTSATENPS